MGILTGAVLAIAIAGVVKSNDLKHRVSALEDEVSSVEGQTVALAQSTGSDAEEELQDLERKQRKLEACLPEVQNEINGLSVEVEAGFAYVENNAQVSTYCQSVIYPQDQGGE